MTTRLCALLASAVLLGSTAASVAQETPDGWYKGNLHTHTLWSDGNEFPEVIVDWYHDRDYNFLVLSDHNVLSEGIRWMKVSEAIRRGGESIIDDYREMFGNEWVKVRGEGDAQEVRLKPLSAFRALYESPDRFLMIQGEEITGRVHMNATNLRELIEPENGNSVEEAIQNNLDAVEEQSQRLGQPMVAQINHLNFGWAVTAEQMAAVADARFFEVYNGHPAVHNQGDAQRPGYEQMWDIANTLRVGEMEAAPVYGVAVDDSHHYREGNGNARPGRGWIMVRAPHLTPEAIVEAMEAGDFYGSTGVVLSQVKYDADAGTLQIAVEPQEGATYTIEFIGTREGYDATSEPIEAEGLDPQKTTRRYSEDVGQVLERVEGTEATYTLKGDELYVRAVIRSDRKPENPLPDDEVQKAWTQPVGWDGRVQQGQAKKDADHGHSHGHQHP